MARRKVSPADALADMVKRKSPTRKYSGPSRSGIEKTMHEMNVMRLEGDWTEARPAHLVALYAWCHEQVYGVAPVELVGLNWTAATTSAAKLVREQFDGSFSDALDFMRWAWRREKKREDWRRANGHDGGRIAWRAQFMHRYILTDYRIATARSRSNAPTQGK